MFLIDGSPSFLASRFLNFMKALVYLSFAPLNSRSSGCRLFLVM